MAHLQLTNEETHQFCPILPNQEQKIHKCVSQDLFPKCSKTGKQHVNIEIAAKGELCWLVFQIEGENFSLSETKRKQSAFIVVEKCHYNFKSQ